MPDILNGGWFHDLEPGCPHQLIRWPMTSFELYYSCTVCGGSVNYPREKWMPYAGKSTDDFDEIIRYETDSASVKTPSAEAATRKLRKMFGFDNNEETE